jgi:hypothetical protein
MNKIVCLLIVLLSITKSIIGVPISDFQINQLLEESEVIGVCKVRDTVTVFPCPEKDGCFEAKCDVLSTLKGQTLSNLTVVTYINPYVNPVNLGFGCLKEGDISILFLKNEKDNIFDFANVEHPKISLYKFYEQQDVPTNSVKQRIRSQLIQALNSNDPQEVINGIYWLTEMDEDVPQERLIQFTKSKNMDLRLAALRRLISYKNPTAIREVALLLLSPDIYKEISNSQFFDLAWTLELEASCVSLDLANRLASSTNAKVQRIGVRILKEVGDSSSIPHLISALDAENIDTQISAIVALSRITGKKGPGWNEFMKNPSAETQKWKNWWQEESKKNSESELSSGSKSTVTNSVKSNVSK